MKNYRAKKLIRDGDLIAEVEVDLHDGIGDWEPTMSKDDAFKVDDVCDAMRRKDYQAVAKLARLYRLVPVGKDQPSSTDAA